MLARVAAHVYACAHVFAGEERRQVLVPYVLPLLGAFRWYWAVGESVRAMLFLFFLLNALPVPMLRQVYFRRFIRCLF